MLPFAHGMQVVILYDTHTVHLVGYYGREAESSLQVQTECWNVFRLILIFRRQLYFQILVSH
jgi:hypothetical protein